MSTCPQSARIYLSYQKKWKFTQSDHNLRVVLPKNVNISKYKCLQTRFACLRLLSCLAAWTGCDKANKIIQILTLSSPVEYSDNETVHNVANIKVPLKHPWWLIYRHALSLFPSSLTPHSEKSINWFLMYIFLTTLLTYI